MEDGGKEDKKEEKKEDTGKEGKEEVRLIEN